MNCREIFNISNEIKQWMLHQTHVGEESLTDWLLYALSRKVNQIHYQSFTKPQEARVTGADWEWWVLFDTGSFRFRVQAKKEKADNYPSLLYSNTHGFQIDKLLNDSRTVNAIPLYAFYSVSTDTTMCSRGYSDEGVFISSALRLYSDFVAPARTRVDIGSILGRSVPLTCFFSCPLINNNEVGFRRFLNQYFNIGYNEDRANEFNSINDFSHDIGYYESYPRYLDVILEGREFEEYYEFEYGHEIGDVDGVIITDMRDGQSEE